MEPQDGEEGQSSGHHHHHHPVLGGDVFEDGGPMSTMSESGGAMAPSPGGVPSDSSYGSHSPDSLMGTSPVFNQRPKKRAKKMWKSLNSPLTYPGVKLQTQDVGRPPTCWSHGHCIKGRGRYCHEPMIFCSFPCSCFVYSFTLVADVGSKYVVRVYNYKKINIFCFLSYLFSIMKWT